MILDCRTAINWGDVATWALAVLTAIYICITYKLWTTSKETLKTAVDSHRDSTQLLELINTAWLAVTYIALEQDRLPSPRKLIYKYKNFGKSPARISLYELKVFLDNKPIENITPTDHDLIVPDQEVEHVIELTLEEEYKITGRKLFSFDLVISYVGIEDLSKICESHRIFDHDKQRFITDKQAEYLSRSN